MLSIIMDLEQKYVIDFYNNNSKSFGNTRYAPWPCVKAFIETIQQDSIVCDIGCGNGKNQYRKDLTYVSCDNSTAMCSLVQDAHCADCTSLPYKDNMCDAVLCIAVIHHLSSENRRIQALCEIKRVLKHKGKALISVWGTHPKFGCGTQIIGWNSKEKQRYIHFFTYEEIDNLCKKVFSYYTITYDFYNFFIEILNQPPQL